MTTTDRSPTSGQRKCTGRFAGTNLGIHPCRIPVARQASESGWSLHSHTGSPAPHPLPVIVNYRLIKNCNYGCRWRGIRLAPGSVEAIRGSYVMIDPHGRFFDSADGGHRCSVPILEVGLALAFARVSFDPAKFLHRGGDYGFAAGPASWVQAPVVSRRSADVREEADLALPV